MADRSLLRPGTGALRWRRLAARIVQGRRFQTRAWSPERALNVAISCHMTRGNINCIVCKAHEGAKRRRFRAIANSHLNI